MNIPASKADSHRSLATAFLVWHALFALRRAPRLRFSWAWAWGGEHTYYAAREQPEMR